METNKDIGKVASLHLHPSEGGEPFSSVEEFELIAGKGIKDNARYFSRPTRRQVSLIEREQIAEHAATLGLPTIAPGAVRSNVETEGINLVELINQHIQIGEAVLLIYQARTPCHKMDALCPGLRREMENQRQGVLAQVVRSGKICVGDSIRWLPAREVD